jgi:hypothetical protein
MLDISHALHFTNLTGLKVDVDKVLDTIHKHQESRYASSSNV